MKKKIREVLNVMESVYPDGQVSAHVLYSQNDAVEEAVRMAMCDSLYVLPEDITEYTLKVMRFAYLLGKEDVPFNEVFKGIIDEGMH